MTAELNADLEKTKVHEELLIFPSFDQGDAWKLGMQLRAAAEATGSSVTIEICRGDDTWFATSMPGTAPANADWARRKRNLVNLLHTSSYAVGLLQKLGTDVPSLMGLDPRDFTPHGGCFPVRVRDTGVVGTITVSGLPQRDDHFLVVREVAKYLEVDLGEAQN
mgnify:CR=1 FL=1